MYCNQSKCCEKNSCRCRGRSESPVGDDHTVVIGEDVHHLVSRHDKLLFEAIKEDDITGVKQALRNGADFQGTSSLRPLVVAALYAGVEVVRTLLQASADANGSVDNRGWTALFPASVRGHKELCLVLLEAAADPRFQDAETLTAAQYAKDQKIKQLLCENEKQITRPARSQSPIPREVSPSRSQAARSQSPIPREVSPSRSQEAKKPAGQGAPKARGKKRTTWKPAKREGAGKLPGQNSNGDWILYKATASHATGIKNPNFTKFHLGHSDDEQDDSN